ncbi:MAG: protein kinase [Chitinophagaceae bacterium]
MVNVDVDLNDDVVVETIRNFVRTNPDIEVYRYIRRGLNGDVYFGRRIKMGDEVVLKFYWSHPKYDEAEEAVILRQIDHENILKIFDLRFVPKNFAYFLSPRISGGDLQGIIDAQKISSKQALDIVAGILSGLTELHSKHRLVHRDLKPGNILYDLETGKPIIADLGAVKAVHDAHDYVTASKSDLYYLPPESFKANRFYYQSDIYQVGIIAYQLLGGNYPINDPNKWLTEKQIQKLESIRNHSDRHKLFETYIGKRILNGTILDTNTLPIYLDNVFKRLISKAVHKDPDQRYQQPYTFLKAVHGLLRSQPDFLQEPDRLIITHDDGKKHQIYQDLRGHLVVEKCLVGKPWRRVNGHDGDIKKALGIVKQ